MKFLILKWIGYIVLSLIYKSCKIEIRGQKHFEGILNNKKPTMLCVWHGRMLFPIYYVLHQKLSPWAIASPYQDGAIVASILAKWNVNILWGSSNRNSDNVSKKIQSIFKNDINSIICITNDGPKGPKHIAKKGSLEIAKKNEANIITITGNASRSWKFRTWDDFVLPKPFSKIFINVAPVYKHENDDIVMGVSDYMCYHEKQADTHFNV
tara:strand:- start:31021 stop:31650 length:630 start_codon:yes stop_codon:yes gene_type:complete